MKTYAIALFLVISLPLTAFAAEAPENMKEFNINCPAKDLCPQFDQYYQLCKENHDSDTCLRYVQLFKKLTPVYDCQRPFDHTPTKDYIVPAFWLCNEPKSWDYIDLLSKLTFSDAQEFFASSQFRSILDGETAEGFYDLSIQREKTLKHNKK